MYYGPDDTEAKAAAEAAGYKTDYYTDEDSSASNYNYITKDSDGNDVYHLVNLRPKYMTSDKKTTWTKLSDGSGYTWSDTTTFPKTSTINYTTDGSGNLTKVDGAVRFKLPGAGDNLEQYYKFEYTPSGEKLSRISSLSGSVSGGYFYGLPNQSYGGAIYNTANNENASIVADFINNSVSSGVTLSQLYSYVPSSVFRT
jgi:hypothetical protein